MVKENNFFPRVAAMAMSTNANEATAPQRAASQRAAGRGVRRVAEIVNRPMRSKGGRGASNILITPRIGAPASRGC